MSSGMSWRAALYRGAVMVTACAVIWSAIGCSPQPEDCVQQGVRCAALVTDFGSVEEGLSQQAWLALVDVRSAGLLDRVDFVETIDTRDRSANIYAFAQESYDIIVTVGTGIVDETTVAARRFPDVHFLGVQQSLEAGRSPGNYATLVFHEERSGFLAGAVAGLLTHTGKVAAVCEVSFIESIRRTCEGFRVGATYVNPAIEVDVIFRSGPAELLFRDREWGRATAVLSVDRGADVIFAVGNETAEAALEGAAASGALIIGAETDQHARPPEIRGRLITSSVLHVRTGLSSLLQETLDGRFQAGPHWGDVGLAPFYDFEASIPPSALTKLQEVSGGLQAGIIQVDIPH